MGTIKEGCLLNICNTQCQKITISCPTPHTLSVLNTTRILSPLNPNLPSHNDKH